MKNESLDLPITNFEKVAAIDEMFSGMCLVVSAIRRCLDTAPEEGDRPVKQLFEALIEHSERGEYQTVADGHTTPKQIVAGIRYILNTWDNVAGKDLSGDPVLEMDGQMIPLCLRPHQYTTTNKQALSFVLHVVEYSDK